MGLFYPPTINGLQKTLDAQLDTGHTAAITLNNTTGIQDKPGIIVINRVDVDGNELPSAVREFVSYTGTSGNTLIGLARGLGGSTDQDHAIGSIVEFVPDITVFQAFCAALDGTDTAGISPHVVKTDTLEEKTPDAGVTADGVLLKDGGVRLANNTPLASRNNADNADVAIAKLDASDKVVLGPNVARPTRFVPITDPSGWHYDSGVTAALTNYTDVNVSSVVSARAFAVAYRGFFRFHGTTRHLFVRQNGEGTDTFDANKHTGVGDQVDIGFNGIVELDGDKIFEFKQDTAGGSNNNCQYTFQVIGYYEYID